MDDSDVRTAALRWGAVAGPLTVTVLVAVAVLVDFPLLLLGMLTFGIPLFVVPGVLGVTNQYQPAHSLPIPNALEVLCWLSGVGVAGGVLLAAVA
jgi:hypothetical protein